MHKHGCDQWLASVLIQSLHGLLLIYVQYTLRLPQPPHPNNHRGPATTTAVLNVTSQYMSSGMYMILEEELQTDKWQFIQCALELKEWCSMQVVTERKVDLKFGTPASSCPASHSNTTECGGIAFSKSVGYAVGVDTPTGFTVYCAHL